MSTLRKYRLALNFVKCIEPETIRLVASVYKHLFSTRYSVARTSHVYKISCKVELNAIQGADHL